MKINIKVESKKEKINKVLNENVDKSIKITKE
jgi:hypothetical protein